tara:strand:- start:126 stop:473 length:348 start_codon:yes stop_codon:yes gene_type:complete
MQGISRKEAELYSGRNEEMYSLYLNGWTLVQIGERYNLTKQRVWQIIRRCKLGDGDYYEAQVQEKEKKQEIEQLSLSGTDAVSHYSQWLGSKGVRRIRKKGERKQFLAIGEKESS